MYLFKKKIINYLYIFLIFITFYFTEFSTKDVLAKTFVVSKIEVEEKYNLNEKKMSVTKKSDGSYQFTIEMQAKLRNDFETPMLVAFISVGQAIKHQENFAKINKKGLNLRNKF